ncbi:WD40 repeat domain-containing protein [Mucilaginibacter myungsuensis]|uniref:WD40 repeat domain-containing protein n=1 Tax=Mucilaginibacter myungsuensis TaxID=649104 RepID=A0A929KZD1_9SPHI|nr:WD40 repeat domain-containing protein [Mucilaginibacter myungsuensis]MBE9662738.1 WD40 repeat domain-containing protein [Mucilaginibacter myungsuensis]MDN3598158.1 WD40 repeat domain-containing protein [Mucilaginibacter myungsuensis]
MNATLITELPGHSNPIYSVELSQKPGILFTGGNDKGLVEWSLKDNAFIKVMFPVPTSIYAIHCPVGYPLMFAGLRSGQVLVFDFIQQKVIKGINHHLKPVFDIKSVASKKELLVASEDGTVTVWHLDTLELLHTVKVSHDTIRSIAISPDEKQVAFGCRDNSVAVYSLEDYSLMSTLKDHTMAVFSTAYTPDGKYILSGSRDAQLKVWDALSYELVQNIPAHLFAINHIACHPTLPLVATASMDKSIKIWDAGSFKLIKNISREKGLPGHVLSVNKLAWDGDHLISAGDDKMVKIWRMNGI